MAFSIKAIYVKDYLMVLFRLLLSTTLIYLSSTFIFSTDNIFNIINLENYAISHFPDSPTVNDFGKLRKLYQIWPPQSQLYAIPIFVILTRYILRCHLQIKEVSTNVIQIILTLPALALIVSCLLFGLARMGEAHYLVIIVNYFHTWAMLSVSTFVMTPWKSPS